MTGYETGAVDRPGRGPGERSRVRPRADGRARRPGASTVASPTARPDGRSSRRPRRSAPTSSSSSATAAPARRRCCSARPPTTSSTTCTCPVVVVRGELRTPVRPPRRRRRRVRRGRGARRPLDGRAALGAAAAGRRPRRRVARRLRARRRRRSGARARARVRGGDRRGRLPAAPRHRCRRRTAPAWRRTAPRSCPSWRPGPAPFALIEASRDADLIVIGNRGRSGLVELIVGSTTLEVLAHAHCAGRRRALRRVGDRRSRPTGFS